jgi:hypothetical protein
MYARISLNPHKQRIHAFQGKIAAKRLVARPIGEGATMNTGFDPRDLHAWSLPFVARRLSSTPRT